MHHVSVFADSTKTEQFYEIRLCRVKDQNHLKIFKTTQRQEEYFLMLGMCMCFSTAGESRQSIKE